MKRAATVTLLLLALIGAWQWQQHWRGAATPPQRGTRIAGGDGGGLPRARPTEEKLDEPSLGHAVALADANGVSVLLVARHGHLLVEHYANGATATDLLDGAGMTAAVLALAGNDAQQLSGRLWQPLNTHDAWLDGCCLRARYADWLRVGILLAQDGRFEGAELVPAPLVAALRSQGAALEAGSKASGAEPFAARDVVYLRGADRTRLWLSPQLQLVVLQVAGAAGANGWDETQLFNQIARAVTDRSAAAAGDLLHQLVPNH